MKSSIEYSETMTQASKHPRKAKEPSIPAASPEYALFLSTDLELWKSRLDAYEEVVSKVKGDKNDKKKEEGKRLIELDRMVFHDMPAAVAARRAKNEKPVLTKEDIVNVVDWKMHRAKWRPNLLNFAKANDANQYVEAVNEAEKEVSKLSSKSTRGSALTKVIEKLSKPKGIGPATSLAIGSILTPQLAFYSDEACKSIPGMLKGGKVEYTQPYPIAFIKEIWGKADELNSAPGSSRAWTPKDIEKALYVDYNIRTNKVKMEELSDEPAAKRQKK